MCCFGVLFGDDEFNEGEINVELSQKIIRYLAVFGDLSIYNPKVVYGFTNIEIALACLICARKRYKVFPNNSSHIFRVYGGGEKVR